MTVEGHGTVDIWEALKKAGLCRIVPDRAGSCRIVPDRAGLCRSMKKKSLISFQKNFFKIFWAKHTKGLKPFRAHFGYRNHLGVRGSLFTEEKSVKPAQSGTIRHNPARSGFFQCPRSCLLLSICL